MAVETTLSIIKPDAVKANNAGNIIAHIQKAGLQVIAMRMIQLSRADAEAFYAVHKERPFYGELCDFMVSGPVVVMALKGEGAIAKYRDAMGATNPAEAADGTIRKLYASNIEANAVHGSDAPETAAVEIPFFFRSLDLMD